MHQAPQRTHRREARRRAHYRALTVVGTVMAVGTAVVSMGTFTAAAGTTQIVTYTHTVTIPAPPASNFAGATGGGDGWALALSNTQLFNVFHHDSILQVNCHNQSDASNCAGYPKTITDASSNGFTSSGQPGLWLDQSSGHLYVYATRASDKTAGVVCIDTTSSSSNPFCGFTALSAVGEAPYSSWGGVTNPVVVGDNWYAFNYVNGTPSGTKDQLMCFSLTSFGACAGQPYAVSLGASPSISGESPSPGIGTSGNDVFVQYFSGGAHLTCFDTNTSATCSGSWPVAASGSAGAPFPLLDSTGNQIGICLPISGDPCYDSTGASATTPSGMTTAIPPGLVWNGPGVVVGPRVYVPNTDAQVECYDYSTRASCSGFPKTLSDLGFLYTVNTDPQRPTCLWVNADDGSAQIQNFDAFTGGTCGQGPLRVLASSFVAPSSQCAPTSWQSLQLTTPPPSGYTSGTVQFLNNDGVALSGIATQNIDSTGSVNLTGLNLDQNGLPQFLITLTGAPSTLSQAIVVISWKAAYDASCVASGTTVTGLTSTAPAQAPIQAATTVHTGEPFAGSLPYEAGTLATGLGLVAAGLARRRHVRRAPQR